MPKISDEKKEARRQQILEAAWRCFQRQGLHVTSMQDIIRECGLSAGAVYLYFRNKDELILEAVTTSLGNIAERTDVMFGDGRQLRPEQFVFELVSILEGFSQREGYDLRRIALLGWSEAQRNETLRRRMMSFYAAFRLRLQGTVEDWQRAGTLPQGDSPAVAATLLSVLLGYVAQAALLADVSPETMRAGISGLLRA